MTESELNGCKYLPDAIKWQNERQKEYINELTSLKKVLPNGIPRAALQVVAERRQRIERKQTQLAKAREWIAALPIDEYQKTILTRRYIDGWNWDRIGLSLTDFGFYAGDTCRVTAKRIIKKYADRTP